MASLIVVLSYESYGLLLIVCGISRCVTDVQHEGEMRQVACFASDALMHRPTGAQTHAANFSLISVPS